MLVASCYRPLYPLAVQPNSVVARPHCSSPSLDRPCHALSSCHRVAGTVKPPEAGRRASASHSCVTSATSQPSTTGRRALQPGDLRARCVATSTMSATLTSRLSHFAPKYRAVRPNLRVFPDFRGGECVCCQCMLFKIPLCRTTRPSVADMIRWLIRQTMTAFHNLSAFQLELLKAKINQNKRFNGSQ